MIDATEHRRLTGRLELLRTRVYRLCNCDEAFAVVEAIGRKAARGEPLSPMTLRAAERFLRAWSAGLAAGDLARAEDIDLSAELDARWHWVAPSHDPPKTATFIVGAPRSGTSYLYNLLAYQGVFAYPTSISCHRWPTWNLVHDPRALLGNMPAAILREDTKALRLRADLALPNEYESLFSRALPSYRHDGGHVYTLRRPRIADAGLLRRDMRAHLAYFGAQHYLSKSPFHTFRMAELQATIGSACRFVHIHRDGEHVAASIATNRFGYRVGDGRRLRPHEAWAVFVAAARDYPRADLVHEVSYESLRAQPRREIQEILRWLDIPDAAR